VFFLTGMFSAGMIVFERLMRASPRSSLPSIKRAGAKLNLEIQCLQKADNILYSRCSGRDVRMNSGTVNQQALEMSSAFLQPTSPFS